MDQLMEFITTLTRHFSEIFIIGLFFSGITYLNIKMKQVKILSGIVNDEIAVLKALYCIKDIREANIDPLMGNAKKEKEFVVTLLSTEEFRNRTTAGKEYTPNKISVLKGIAILEKDIMISEELVNTQLKHV